LSLKASSKTSGHFREPIAFKWGDDSLEIPATLQIAAPVALPPAAPTVTPPTFDPQNTSKQKLQITGLEQKNGRLILRWSDPNPDPRTYRLELQRLTSQAVLERESSALPDVGTEKFSPEQFAAQRLKLDDLLNRTGTTTDKVVKRWAPLEAVDLCATGPQAFQAAFPIPPDQQTIRIRISSILSDGTLSPVASEIRIPITPKAQAPWPSFQTIAVAALLVALVLLAARRLAFK
jgi:hypothetical protein